MRSGGYATLVLLPLQARLRQTSVVALRFVFAAAMVLPLVGGLGHVLWHSEDGHGVMLSPQDVRSVAVDLLARWLVFAWIGAVVAAPWLGVTTARSGKGTARQVTALAPRGPFVAVAARFASAMALLALFVASIVPFLAVAVFFGGGDARLIAAAVALLLLLAPVPLAPWERLAGACGMAVLLAGVLLPGAVAELLLLGLTSPLGLARAASLLFAVVASGVLLAVLFGSIGTLLCARRRARLAGVLAVLSLPLLIWLSGGEEGWPALALLGPFASLAAAGVQFGDWREPFQPLWYFLPLGFHAAAAALAAFAAFFSRAETAA